MKKDKLIYILFFSFMFCTMFSGVTIAEELQNKGKELMDCKYKNLFFYFDGQVFIDSQINGVSYDCNNFDIMLNDVQIEIDDESQVNLYNVYKIYNGGDELVCEVKTNGFSSNSKITVRARVYAENVDNNAEIKNFESPIEKVFYLSECENYYFDDDNKESFGLKLDKQELQRKISFDVIFKLDELYGVFEENYLGMQMDNYNYIEITGIVPGSIFPEIPKLISTDDVIFDCWYDEINQKCIQEFPLKVNADYSFIAYWKKKNSEINLMSNIDLLRDKAINLPNMTSHNNIFKVILSYVISFIGINL